MNPNTKLKNYKYHIAGTDSNRPLMECLQAIALGAFVVIATIGLCFAAVFASDIDIYFSTILP
jgi:hypothetical protein